MASRAFTSQFNYSFEKQLVNLVGKFTQTASRAKATLVNQAVTYTAAAFGPAGNSITMTLVDPGNVTSALAITVVNTDISVSLGSTAAVAAHLTNQGVTYTAQTAGTAGNSITIALVDPGAASQSLSIGVVGNAITVNLATDSGSLITTTASQIVAAINGNAPAHALVQASGAGASAVTALSATPLASGAAHALTTTATQLVSALQANPSVTALITISGSGASALTALTQTALSGGQDIAFSSNQALPLIAITQIATGQYRLTLSDRYSALLSSNIMLLSASAADLSVQLITEDVNSSNKSIDIRTIAVGSGSPVETNLSDGMALLIDLKLRNVT